MKRPDFETDFDPVDPISARISALRSPGEIQEAIERAENYLADSGYDVRTNLQGIDKLRFLLNKVIVVGVEERVSKPTDRFDDFWGDEDKGVEASGSIANFSEHLRDNQKYLVSAPPAGYLRLSEQNDLLPHEALIAHAYKLVEDEQPVYLNERRIGMAASLFICGATNGEADIFIHPDALDYLRDYAGQIRATNLEKAQKKSGAAAMEVLISSFVTKEVLIKRHIKCDYTPENIELVRQSLERIAAEPESGIEFSGRSPVKAKYLVQRDADGEFKCHPLVAVKIGAEHSLGQGEDLNHASGKWVKGFEVCSHFGLSGNKYEIAAANTLIRERYQTGIKGNDIRYGHKSGEEGSHHYLNLQTLKSAEQQIISKDQILQKATEIRLSGLQDVITFEEAIIILKGSGPDTITTERDISDLAAFLKFRLWRQPNLVIDKESLISISRAISMEEGRIASALLDYLGENYLSKFPDEGNWVTGASACAVLGIHNSNAEIMNDMLRALWIKTIVAEFTVGDREYPTREVFRRCLRHNKVSVYVNADLLPQIISADDVKQRAKMSFEHLLDNYIKSGGRSFKDFTDILLQKWGLSKAELAEYLGVSASFIYNVDDDVGQRATASMSTKLGLNKKHEQDLKALCYGTLDLGSIDDMVKQATKILLEKNPKISDFQNTILGQQITKTHGAVGDDGSIDKTKVPNALLTILLKRTGTTFTEMCREIGYSYEELSRRPLGVHGILDGDYGFMVQRAGTNTKYVTSKVLDVAKFFTDDQQLAENLSMIFLEIPKKYAPCELVSMVQKEEITVGEAVRTLRLQKYLTSAQLERVALGYQPNDDVQVGGTMISNIEDKNRPVKDTQRAARIIEKLYEDYPEDNSKMLLSRMICGKEAKMALA